MRVACRRRHPAGPPRFALELDGELLRSQAARETVVRFDFYREGLGAVRRREGQPTLEQSLISVVLKHLHERIVKTVRLKLKNFGLKLSEEQEATLIRRLQEKDLTNWTFETAGEGDIVIEFTDDEVADLERTFDRGLDAIRDVLPGAIEKTAPSALAKLDGRWPSEWKRQQRSARTFEQRLFQHWAAPLGSLAQLVTVSREIALQVNNELPDEARAKLQSKSGALIRLHMRACRVADEILSLLRSGHIDAAMARWRTLHEIAVVSIFLTDRPDVVAARYVAHQGVENYRAKEAHRRLHQKGRIVTAFDESTARSIDAEFDRVRSLYSDEAFLNDYGWAAPFLGDGSNQRIKFSQIEEAARIDHLRPYYRLASHGVHANSRGAFFSLGLPEGESAMLFGPSWIGLSVPGQNAAISLAQVTVATSMLHMNLEMLLSIEVAQLLSERVCKEFASAEEALQTKNLKIDLTE